MYMCFYCMCVFSFTHTWIWALWLAAAQSAAVSTHGVGWMIDVIVHYCLDASVCVCLHVFISLCEQIFLKYYSCQDTSVKSIFEAKTSVGVKIMFWLVLG